MTDQVGQQIGSYRLLRLLGKGGFAEVYLGEHIYLQTQVALKLLHARLAPAALEDFLSEARMVAHLAHPHIVRVFDFGVEADTPYLAMEYAPGGSLRQRHPRGLQLPLASVITYTRQVAEALDYAHAQRLIHRDIKPENLLLRASDELVLSDFGIATAAQSSHALSTQDVAGTAAYMAPEQFQGKPRPASDQYSLGIVLYEWLAGSPPFQGTFLEISGQHLHAPPPSLRQRRPDLSPEVEAAVLTALAKDPRQRFATAQAFAAALAQASTETTGAQTIVRAPAVLLYTRPATSAMESISGDTTTAEPVMEPTERLPSGMQPTRISVPSEIIRPADALPVLPPAEPQTVIEMPQPDKPERHKPSRKRSRSGLLIRFGAAALLIVLLTTLLAFTYAQNQSQRLAATQTTLAQSATGTAGQNNAQTAVAQQGTKTAQGATATAENITITLPYSVQVPGPCGASNVAWSFDQSIGSLDCQVDHVTLKSDGVGASITFTMNPFPTRYTVSIKTSNLIGSQAGVTLEVDATTANYGYALALGPGKRVFFDILSGTHGGGPATTVNTAQTNTIGIAINGSAGKFLLNGSQEYAGTLGISFVTATITIRLDGGAGSQVDLQDFTITPD